MDSCIMCRFEVSEEKGLLRVALSRRGVRFARVCTILAFLGTAVPGAWMLTRTPAVNWAIVLAYVVIVTGMAVVIAWLDSGFAPVVFDRGADRIERKGRAIGRLGDVRCVWVAERSSEEGIHSYHVLLVKAGARADRDEAVELGEAYEPDEARGFSRVIADFLGVAVGEGYEPKLGAKVLIGEMDPE